MKKVLSFVLTLAMILGCTTMAFATADYADMSLCSRQEAVTVLTDLGLIQGVGNNLLNPKGDITRAEVTTLMVRILGYEDYGKDKTATGFTDVPKSHWASGYIEFARKMNLVEGVGGNKFNPDSPMTYQEVVTVLLRTLGHSYEVSDIYWPYNYIFAAKDLDILGDVACNATNATREDVMQLIFNVLALPMGKTDKNGVFTAYSPVRNLLTIAGATSVTKLVDFADARALDDMGMLGHYITTYTNKNGKLVSLIDHSVELSGIVSGGALYVGTTKYTFAAKSFDTPAALFINNAKLGIVASSSALATDVALDVVLNGTVIEQVYSAKTYSKTVTVQVITADAITATSTAFKGYNFALTNGAFDAKTFVVSGAAGYTAITAGNIVDIYAGENRIARLDVSTKTVCGAPTKKSGNTYTINNVEYKSLVDLTLGATYVCYLGVDGVITFAKLVESAPTTYTTMYGFYVASNAAVSWGKTTIEYKVSAVDGKVYTFDVASATDLNTYSLYKWTFKDSKFDSVTPVATYSDLTYAGIGLYGENLLGRMTKDTIIISIASDGAYSFTSLDKLEKNVNLAPVSGGSVVMNDDCTVAIVTVDKDKTHGDVTTSYALVNSVSYLYQNKKVITAFNGYLNNNAVTDYAIDVDGWYAGFGVYQIVSNADATLTVSNIMYDDCIIAKEVIGHGIVYNTANFVELDKNAVVYCLTNGAMTLSTISAITSGASVQLFNTNADAYYDIAIWSKN